MFEGFKHQPGGPFMAWSLTYVLDDKTPSWDHEPPKNRKWLVSPQWVKVSIAGEEMFVEVSGESLPITPGQVSVYVDPAKDTLPDWLVALIADAKRRLS